MGKYKINRTLLVNVLKSGPIGKMKAFTYFKMIFSCVDHKFRTMVFLIRFSQKYFHKEYTKTQYADRKST